MDFNAIIPRRNTESFKWNCYREDVLPMWLADMDFRSPEPVINALKARVDHGIFGYGLPPEGLLQAVVRYLQNRQGWQIEKEAISFVSGVVSGFTHAIYSLTQAGDGILMQTPVYPPFLAAPEATGRRRVQNELILGNDGKYEIDFDDFEEKAASGVKLFILCNPHNPVGRVFNRNELTKMAEICLKNDVWICSDEIHLDFIYPGNRHIPIAKLSPEVADITVTYFAPSKSFNVAGFSTSFCIATNPKMRERLCQSFRMLLGHPNILGLHAAYAAYRDSLPWLDALLVYLHANRDYLFDFVNSALPGVKMWKPEGTFLAWLDCRELNLAISPHQFFLEKAKVGLNEGRDFGEAGQGFVRLNFGCPRALLEESLQRMKNALDHRMT